MENKKGKMIVFEGIDGCGKSTMIRAIFNKLDKMGFPVIATREPGGVPSAEDIRSLIFKYELDDLSEAYSFCASRRENLVNKILPNMKEGKVILCDRFVESSLVYQGIMKNQLDKVVELNNIVLDGFKPDLTLILDVDARIMQNRLAERKDSVNRLDIECLSKQEQFRKAYLNISEYSPSEKVVVLNLTNNFTDNVKKVLNEVMKIL